MIEANGLSKRYGDVVAVDDVSFQIGKGEVVGFLGPNGAGKTTTMRIITGSLGATEGEVSLDGKDVAAHPRETKARIGYLPEVPPLYGDMTVRNYVRFAARLKGVEDIKGATAIVARRSRSSPRMRLAAMPGIAQAKLLASGRKLLPERPKPRSARSSRNTARAM